MQKYYIYDDGGLFTLQRDLELANNELKWAMTTTDFGKYCFNRNISKQILYKYIKLKFILTTINK